MKPYGIIYITLNKINNKKYIGQHTKINDDYLGSGQLLNRAIHKYGKENFERRTLDIAFSKTELNIKEKCWISIYNATNNEEFYNIHEGGSGGNTWAGKTEKEKQNFKLKMSKMSSGVNNGMYGRHHTLESKLKIAQNRLKNDYPYFKSEEFRLKISKVTKGKNNGMYGRKHSKESKELMSINSLGKVSGSKNGMFNKKGELAINGKKVYQYLDLDMKIKVNEFNTVGCVLKYLNLKGHKSLDKAIKNRTIYKGYYWSK